MARCCSGYRSTVGLARAYPSVAYSAAANGGNGGYLIAYTHQYTATYAQEICGKVTQADLADL